MLPIFDQMKYILLGLIFFSAYLANAANPSGTYNHPTKNASLTILSVVESPTNDGYWRVEFEIDLYEQGSYMYLQAASAAKIPISDNQTHSGSGNHWRWVKVVDYAGGYAWNVTAEGVPDVAEGIFPTIEDEKFPFYDIVSPTFYNNSDTTVTYYLELYRDGNDTPLTETVTLSPNYAFQAAGGGDEQVHMYIYQVAGGGNILLGVLTGQEYGQFTTENMPEDYGIYTVVNEANPGEYDDYEPPVLPRTFQDITEDALEDMPASLNEFPGFVEIDPELPGPGDDSRDYAEDNALNLEKLMKHDQMLWEKGMTAMDKRFEYLNQQQQARHDQMYQNQKKQLDEIEEQTGVIKNEFDESQLQGNTIINKLSDIEENTGKSADYIDEQKALVEGNPSIGQMENAGASAAQQIESSYDVYYVPTGIADETGSENPAVWELEFLGHTIDANPMNHPLIAECIYFTRKILFWFAFFWYAFNCFKEINELSRQSLQLQQAKGNAVLGGSGAQATAFTAATVITGILLTLPIALWGQFDTSIGGLTWGDLATTNPIDTAGTSAIIQAAVWLCLQFIPLQQLIGMWIGYMTLKTQGTALLAGVATLIRYVVP